MSVRFISILVDISSAFLLTVDYYSVSQIYHNFFIHSPVDEHYGCFQCWDITNEASMNIHVQGFVWIHVISATTVASGWCHVLKITYCSCAVSLPAYFLLPFTFQLT